MGLVIAAVLGSWWLTALFVTLMWGIASFTPERRALPGHGTWWTALPVGLALVASGLAPATSIATVPALGILTGNAMTAASLTRQRMIDALVSRRGEPETDLSIGLLDREARLLVTREDAALALVPGMDQTRTVGLVARGRVPIPPRG